MDIRVQKVIRHNRNLTLMPFPWGDYSRNPYEIATWDHSDRERILL